MPSKNYRYYCLDVTGELLPAEWFHADNDDEAVAYVQAKHPRGIWEIFQERRLVAAAGGNPTSDILATNRRVQDSRSTLVENACLAAQHPQSTDGGDAR